MDVDPVYENIKAPQFFDFTNPESSEMENPEAYFEFDHEAGLPIGNALGDEEPNSFINMSETTYCQDGDSSAYQTIIENDESEKTLVNPSTPMVKESIDCSNNSSLVADSLEQVAEVSTHELSRVLKTVCLDNNVVTHEEFLSTLKARNEEIASWNAVGESSCVESTPAADRGRASSNVEPRLSLETPEAIKKTLAQFDATKIKYEAHGSTRLTTGPRHGPMKAMPHTSASHSSREGLTFAEIDSEFAGSLRNYDGYGGSASSLYRPTTRTEPFHFQEARSKTKEEIKPFVSMAEQLLFFEKGTPKRFKSTKRLTRSNDDISIHYRTTQPHTPKLSAMHRQRPVHALSREQLEDQEVEEAQKHKFKANPLNEKILQEKSVLPRVFHKELTMFEPFNLTESHRGGPNKENIPERPEFHARPVPRSLLEEPKLPEKKVMAVTVPESPDFASNSLPKRREAQPQVKNEPSIPNRLQRSKSVDRNLHRHFGSSCSVGSSGSSSSSNPTKRPLTTFQPFKVEERSQNMIKQRDEKIKKLLEEEKKARQFHAQPLPKLDKLYGVPEKPTILPTVPKPFIHKSDERAQLYREKFNQKQEEEENRLKKEATFHARPPVVLKKEQFKPEPAQKPPTEFVVFNLHSDTRAKQREEFDEFVKQKEAELEAQRRQAEIRRREEEQEEIARLRKQMVTKANPVPNYKPFKLNKSDKPLTIGQSPNFKIKPRSSSTDSQN
ncbi:targeting protein for Xklp2-like [Artemia franciscana]|uniref:Targeting protein for Xklp2 n=1 Tax=Artemia franciscana TaxID=6661 RepID=A0AA88I362_ARTSF|nr:hypothetical protein QYM36_006200 [Artemia franciscana]